MGQPVHGVQGWERLPDLLPKKPSWSTSRATKNLDTRLYFTMAMGITTTTMDYIPKEKENTITVEKRPEEKTRIYCKEKVFC